MAKPMTDVDGSVGSLDRSRVPRAFWSPAIQQQSRVTARELAVAVWFGDFQATHCARARAEEEEGWALLSVECLRNRSREGARVGVDLSRLGSCPWGSPERG